MDRKPLAVILLSDDSRSAALGRELDEGEARALVVHSTDEFHQTINQECVDLVIIENRLKGFLSGIEILERMHHDLVRPATILLSEPTVEVERRARKLGADRVLSPQTPLQQLTETACLLLKTSSHERIFIPTQARQLVQQVGAIGPLPQLLVKLSSYLDQGDEDVIEPLTKDVSVDAGVTAELLKLTNSSAMGRPYKTTNVHDAVRFLGVRRTVAMILSSGISKAQSSMLRAINPQLRSWYQYRSVLIGSTAASFASSLEEVSAPTAYLLGLLQDIGMLVFGYVYGSRYDQLLERVGKISHLCREQVEFAEFETNHAQVSAALMQKWELPGSLVSMVLRHHERDSDSDRPHVDQAFARVMLIGERVADVVDSRAPKRFLDLNASLGHYGRCKADECREALAAAVARSVESSKLFSMPPPDPKLISGLLADLAAKCSSDQIELPENSDEPATSEETLDINPAGPDDWQPEVEIKHRILLVEDEAPFVRLVRKWLDGLPIEVFACDSVEEAIRLSSEVELVIADLHLGSESGLTVIDAIRKNGYGGKVVMVTGDPRRETVKHCIQFGINDFLAKPFSRQRLVESITRQLHAPVQKQKLLAGRPLTASTP